MHRDRIIGRPIVGDICYIYTRKGCSNQPVWPISNKKRILHAQCGRTLVKVARMRLLLHFCRIIYFLTIPHFQEKMEYAAVLLLNASRECKYPSSYALAQRSSYYAIGQLTTLLRNWDTV